MADKLRIQIGVEVKIEISTEISTEISINKGAKKITMGLNIKTITIGTKISHKTDPRGFLETDKITGHKTNLSVDLNIVRVTSNRASV